MGRVRCQSEGSSLVEKRVSSHLQPPSSFTQGNATSDPRLPPPPSLVTVYRDQVKDLALRDMVQQLLEKQCVRVMTETETGFSQECF